MFYIFAEAFANICSSSLFFLIISSLEKVGSDDSVVESKELALLFWNSSYNLLLSLIYFSYCRRYSSYASSFFCYFISYRSFLAVSSLYLMTKCSSYLRFEAAKLAFLSSFACSSYLLWSTSEYFPNAALSSSNLAILSFSSSYFFIMS